MFEILPETQGQLIALKAMGRLTAADYEVLQAEMDGLLAVANPARILLDWTELEGFDAEGDRRSFLFWLGEWSKIDRIAIVSSDKFLSEVNRVAEALSHSKVRHFRPSHADEARRWVEEG